MHDPSKPLPDGQHETFAKLLAAGKMSQVAAYRAAGYKNDRTQACKLAAKHSIPERVAWLKKRSASVSTMSATEKREILAGLARNGSNEPRDIISAIKEDNNMSGDNEPTETKIEIIIRKA